MSLILNIDTASARATISVAKDGNPIAEKINEDPKGHASFLHIAIQQLCTEVGIHLHQFSAIAVNAGPGSYTGLRVGMAAAKGLCYALQKPLICISALEILSATAIASVENIEENKSSLFCAMIDARRNEVFTAVYDYFLNNVVQPFALILEEKIIVNEMLKSQIYYFGDGASKWKNICKNQKAVFIEFDFNSLTISKLSYKYFLNFDFADQIYSAPFYLKGGTPH